MPELILKNLLSRRSVVLVNTEQRQDEIMKRMSELSPHGTAVSSPVEDVPLPPEEMLPVVSNVGDESSKTPHISRGGDVRIISSENLGSQVAHSSTSRGAVVVHGGGALTYRENQMVTRARLLCFCFADKLT